MNNRNKPCHCGSGMKYKKCHYITEHLDNKFKNKKDWTEKDALEYTERLVKKTNYYGKDCDCIYHCEKCDPNWDRKGKLNGRCNRTCCATIENVIYFNHSTRFFYCNNCAILINDSNREDAIRLYGHDLCLTEKGLTPDQVFQGELNESHIAKAN